LSTTFKPKEPTFQVSLDVLSLTPFYQAFLISASVPAIYMHEFWATISFHKHCIKFKMNKKNYSFDLETFRDMLQICLNLPGQKFVDPPFEEEILSFIKKLGYSGNMKSLSDAKVETLPQPWRTFRTIINKCLSGKVTGNDLLRLSRAQILWGMYYQKNIDYVYLLWEDLVYQIKNKEAKKNKDMYYATFTKVIINHFMEKTDQSPKASPGKRLKATAKVAKSRKKKLPDKGLENLSEVALSEAEQMKIAIKRSKTQFHSSQASSSGARKGTGVIPGVPDVPTFRSDDEQISWKSSNDEDDDDQDDDNEQTKSDNDGDDFVHPRLSTFDEEERHEEKMDEEEEGSDQRFHTPSHFKSTDDEVYDEVTQGDNVEEENLDEEKTNKEEEVNELYNDVNINLEGRDTEMTDALLANVQATQFIEDTHVIMTDVSPKVQQQSSSVSSGFISNMLNSNLDIVIDSILNINIESTSLVDVLVTTNNEIPPSYVTTLPPLPIPLIQPMQQTPISTPTIAPSTSLQNLLTFGSLFKLKDRVKALKDDFLKFKQTNLFAKAVSSIHGENCYWEVQLQALVDGKKVIITESTVRIDLQLEDAEGVDYLANAAIFEQLTLMGKKIFRNMRMVGKGFSERKTPLFPTIMVQAQEEMGEGLANPTNPHHTPTIILPSTFQPQKKQKPRKTQRKDIELPQTSGPTTNITDEAINEEMNDSLVRAAITGSSLEAEQDIGNINKIQSKATPIEPSSQGTCSGGGPRCQETMRDTIAQTRSENVSKFSNDSLLAGVNTPRSDEDNLKLKELMELCTNLQNKVFDLENTKITQALVDSLKRRIKKLEKKQRSRTHKLKRLYKVGLTAKVESSKDEGLGEDDASKQGRITDIDANKDIYLVNVHTDEDMFGVNDLDGDEVIVDDAEMLFDVANDLRGEEVFVSQEVPLKEVNVAAATTTTATISDITLAKALIEIKSARPKADKVVIQESKQGTTTTTTAATTIIAASTRPKAKGLVIHKQEQAPTPTVYSQQPSQVNIQDKGKGKMVEQERVKKLSKKDQLMLDEELAFKLQAEEEEERIA
nr:hypothetical protein [Tanacetum cinerariifolium]